MPVSNSGTVRVSLPCGTNNREVTRALEGASELDLIPLTGDGPPYFQSFFPYVFLWLHWPWFLAFLGWGLLSLRCAGLLAAVSSCGRALAQAHELQ